MPALAAFKASTWAGATCEPACAGPGATRGVATAREAAPHRRLGREARWEIASRAAHSTPSSPLACGITCPPPGVNRDPPAQSPAGTFGPEVDQSSRAAAALRGTDAQITPSRAGSRARPVPNAAAEAMASRVHRRTSLGRGPAPAGRFQAGDPWAKAARRHEAQVPGLNVRDRPARPAASRRS
jgi:hypothetical protein